MPEQGPAAGLSIDPRTNRYPVGAVLQQPAEGPGIARGKTHGLHLRADHERLDAARRQRQRGVMQHEPAVGPLAGAAVDDGIA